MSSVWLLYLLVPVVIGLFLAEYKADIFRVIKTRFFDEDAIDDSAIERRILIFVPSARANFAQRSAIRNTWLGHAQRNGSKRMLLKFVIGSRACDIHVLDLVNEYSCKKWNVVMPPSVETEMIAVREIEILNPIKLADAPHNRIYGQQSLAFTVLYPIIVTKFGAFWDEGIGKASVRLLESSTQREIVRTVFSKETPGVRVGSYRFRPVEKYILPKGFSGVIVADNLSTGSSQLPVTNWNPRISTSIDNSSGVLHFFEDIVLPDGHYEDVNRWNALHIHLVSFAYQIHEVEELRKHVTNASTRSAERQQDISDETALLAEESRRYGDIQFVDVVDVYRNIPRKLLEFARLTIQSDQKFHMMIKTDDDCYLDIDKIVRRLDLLKTNESRVWLGRFRSNWIVEKHGKWMEREYTGDLYPKFACGSGYALSNDLVRWLANNADDLKTYQGEDVSLGIWMAALGPRFIDEPLWQCEKECLSDMYSMPQLRPEELAAIWTAKLKCGDPCGCS